MGALCCVFVGAALLLAADDGMAHVAGAVDVLRRPVAPVETAARGVPEAVHRHGRKALGTWLLFITLEGDGFGNVTSSPGTINCGSLGASCTNAFADGTQITLTAIAEPESVFAGWTGDPPCATGQFSIEADTHCIATFSVGVDEFVFANGFEGGS
ncbi:MAG TPA: hypothetical protein PKZ76_10485 [Xanthomonadaceae bacterium]|nr:hypothetical protein [Xanthomonadaceae bacterium]